MACFDGHSLAQAVLQGQLLGNGFFLHDNAVPRLGLGKGVAQRLEAALVGAGYEQDGVDIAAVASRRRGR